MSLGAFGPGETMLRIKQAVVNAIGWAGLSVAAFADSITFHESNLFKACVAVAGLALVIITIYSVVLDVRIKQKKLDDE